VQRELFDSGRHLHSDANSSSSSNGGDAGDESCLCVYTEVHWWIMAPRGVVRAALDCTDRRRHVSSVSNNIICPDGLTTIAQTYM